MTSTPTARFFTCSVKSRATSSATSASSSARRTSRSRVDVGFGQRAAPRQAVENAAELFRQTVEHSKLDPCSCLPLPACGERSSRRSFSEGGSGEGAYPQPRALRNAPSPGSQLRCSPPSPRKRGEGNTIAPEGASRCRAVASGLAGTGRRNFMSRRKRRRAEPRVASGPSQDGVTALIPRSPPTGPRKRGPMTGSAGVSKDGGGLLLRDALFQSAPQDEAERGLEPVKYRTRAA